MVKSATTAAFMAGKKRAKARHWQHEHFAARDRHIPLDNPASPGTNFIKSTVNKDNSKQGGATHSICLPSLPNKFEVPQDYVENSARSSAPKDIGTITEFQSNKGAEVDIIHKEIEEAETMIENVNKGQNLICIPNKRCMSLASKISGPMSRSRLHDIVSPTLSAESLIGIKRLVEDVRIDKKSRDRQLSRNSSGRESLESSNEGIFEAQHYHLISCLEEATVSWASSYYYHKIPVNFILKKEFKNPI
ncbi:unnamed protein product [Protopolystoma xenopodis]|uniref:Uncharacterized protein n=1 Tax=Protopolystoma xenopodis TaxID=117903 RepID=A0A3S5B5R8_9PLAT|nr:unnamed protein product [Protopolystoma xenopodis]